MMGWRIHESHSLDIPPTKMWRMSPLRRDHFPLPTSIFEFLTSPCSNNLWYGLDLPPHPIKSSKYKGLLHIAFPSLKIYMFFKHPGGDNWIAWWHGSWWSFFDFPPALSGSTEQWKVWVPGCLGCYSGGHTTQLYVDYIISHKDP